MKAKENANVRANTLVAPHLGGEVLESCVTKRRDRNRSSEIPQGINEEAPQNIGDVIDRFRPCRAAMKVIGRTERPHTGRWLNNWAGTIHQLFRRKNPAMLPFRRMRCLQKFLAAQASVHNHFNQERHLYSQDSFKLNRAAVLAEWRSLGAS